MWAFTFNVVGSVTRKLAAIELGGHGSTVRTRNPEVLIEVGAHYRIDEVTVFIGDLSALFNALLASFERLSGCR